MVFAIGVHDLRYDRLQDIPVTRRQVIPFVFRKDGQEEERYGRIVIVVDHPHASAGGPTSLAALARPQRAAAALRSGTQQGVERRSATLAGAGQASQDGGGERLRVPWGTGLGNGGLESWGDRFQRTTTSL